MKTEPASMNQDTLREFEHTGDAGIEVEAPSRADLFACAAIGLARIMVAPDAIEPRETLTLEVFGASDADLLHEALSDALNLFLSDGFIWRDATAEERADGMALKLTGEQFSRFRHTMLTELKAVTDHQTKVERRDGEWKARIVFDL
ncbi:MAG TPA: archease [Candidatus Binataceae bacterium]|nr:archease [Candidatus Binataceae bacterium]